MFAPDVRTVVVIALLAALPLPAMAQDSAGGRYTMQKADNGFIRLDTLTGAVAMCAKKDSGWTCDPVADTAAASRAEIEELKRQNSELREEVRRLEDLLGLNGGPPRGPRHSFRLPSEKEVDDALNYFERMMRKLQDRLQRLEQNKALPPSDNAEPPKDNKAEPPKQL